MHSFNPPMYEIISCLAQPKPLRLVCAVAMISGCIRNSD